MIRVGEGTSPEPDKIPTAQTTDSGKANENNSPSIQQLKAFQAMADNSPRVQHFKAYQEMVDNSPRVQQFKAYQEMADNYLQGDDKIKFVKGVDNSKVTEGVISVLKRLSDKVGLKNIIVTGTARTARRQAEVMYAKLKLGEPDAYKTPGRRVQKVYNDMVKDGETDKKKIIDAMYDKILEEGPSNVSRLSYSIFCIEKRGVTKASKFNEY